MSRLKYKSLEFEETFDADKNVNPKSPNHDIKEHNRKNERLSNASKVLVYIACFMQSFLITGFGYGLSVIYAELVQVFTVPRSEVALIQSLFIGINYIGGIFWNQPVKKYGAGTTVMTATIVGCLGILVSPFTESVLLIIALVGALGGAAFGICLITPYIVANATFGKYRMVILASITCATSLGQFVFTMLMELLVEEYGWNGCFLITSGLLLNCFVCGLTLNLLDPSKYKRSQNEQAPDKHLVLFRRDLFKDWKLWLLAIVSLILPVTGATESRFYVDLLVLKGYTRETGSFMTSFIGVANLCGRILGTVTTVCGHFVRSIDHSIYSSLINAISHLMVVYITSYWGLFAAAIINGSSYGFYCAHLPIIIIDIFGKEKYASALATMNMVSGIGFFLSGVLGGLIQDVLGTYDALFFFAFAGTVLVSIIQLILAFRIRQVDCFSQESSYEQIP